MPSGEGRPFVLVAQHDRSFVRAADLAAVVDAMAAANALAPLSRNTPGYAKKDGASFRLNYVGFPTSTTATHARHVLSKYALEIAPFEAPTTTTTTTKTSVALLPLLQFYDSMHVASTRWYLSRVFGRERYCTLPKGGFIEDTLGQLMLRAARGRRARRKRRRRRRPAPRRIRKQKRITRRRASSTRYERRTALSART